MAAISKIIIDGVKAFPNDFTLDLAGKNLLMYGENGSGKSSIFYALYTFFQSQCKSDKSKIYFNTSESESIVNKFTNNPNAKVEILLEGSDVIYRVSHNGYTESVSQTISPFKDLNGQCVFINHRFLFNFFSFSNSQYIDLFPVFIRDVFPFTLTEDDSEFISDIYDDVIIGIKKNGRRRIDSSYNERIQSFNKETKYIVDLINSNALNTATKIYNEHFRNSGDRELKITLSYDNNSDNIPQPNKSYWLRYGYRYQYVEIAGVRQEKKVGSILEIQQPVITLVVEEKKDDGSFYNIEKPQTYFNEAKLTAIALSIRFALLDLVTAPNGRFMALDDMLISLDMSNRMKVIDYLFVISNKYKIYLFTHDRAFFEIFKDKIRNINLKNQLPISEGWVFKEIYNDDNSLKNPTVLPSDDAYTRALYYFKKFDYPASANYLRKSVEEMITLFPSYVSKNEDGSDKEKLRHQLETAIKLLKRTDGNVNDIQTVIGALNTLLNPLSHRSIDTDIYKTELIGVFNTLPRLKKHIIDMEFKEVIAMENSVVLYLDENANKSCEIYIRLKEPLYSYKDTSTGNRVLSQTSADTLYSITIDNGVRGVQQDFKFYENCTLKEICIKLHNFLRKVYPGNYMDFYKDKNGNSFTSLI